MKLSKTIAKVYVVCPANTATGGPLLLHQLALKLIENGINAYMYYFETKESNPNQPVHEFYKRFSIPYETKIDDSSTNLIVVPETEPEYIFKFKNVQKVIWWLSVDNYLSTHAKKSSFSLKRWLGIKPKNYFYNFDNIPQHDHWSQSNYAIDFLKNKGFYNVKYLSDYLDPVFLDEVSQLNFEQLNKENTIVYNPKKGLEVTQALIQMSPNYNWIAIENMTPNQVKALLLRSKLYVDFGNHPGKDRIPREAAVCGCIVITNKKGSAKYFEDVPIDESYKFENVLHTPELFKERVESIFNNYATHSANFKPYRDKIIMEEQKFDSDLKAIIETYFC